MDRTAHPARRWRVILAAATMLTLPANAQTTQAPVTAELRAGSLSFVGHATVGDFVGVTSSVSGAVTGDVSSAHGWVEARVATLVTHNERRDRDLRASMEVDRYPTMRFDLAGTTAASTAGDGGDAHAVQLHGRLAIHGVTRAVDLPASVARTGDTIRVTAEFPVDLADYRIGGLTKMFGLLRMQRQIEVRVDLRFVSAGPQQARGDQ